MGKKRMSNHFLKIYVVVETQKQEFQLNVLLEFTMAAPCSAAWYLGVLPASAAVKPDGSHGVNVEGKDMVIRRSPHIAKGSGKYQKTGFMCLCV